MKKLLFAFLATVFAAISFQAEAGWNIRQNEDGTTDWVKTDPVTSSSQIKSEVGQVIISGYMANIAVADTIGIAVPITSAKIVRVQVVVDGTFGGAANIFTIWRTQGASGTFYTVDDSTTGAAAALTAEVTDGAQRMQVGLNLNISGLAGIGGRDVFEPTGNHFVGRDHVIVISGNGGAVNTTNGSLVQGVNANFIITLVPR